MQDSIIEHTKTIDTIALGDSVTILPHDSIAVLNEDSISANDETMVYEPIVIDRFHGVAYKREIPTDNWTIVSLFGTIVLLGVAININAKLWSHNLQSIWNQATADRVFRERSNQNNLFNVLIELLSYLSLTIFAIQVQSAFEVTPILQSSFLYLLTFIGIALFINIKSLIFQLLGSIFDVQEEASEYNFHREQRNHWIGTFLLPVIIIGTVIPHEFAKTLAIAGFLIMIFFYGISSIRGVKIFIKKAISIYYLILYLCTLEILPILLLAKILEIA